MIITLCLLSIAPEIARRHPCHLRKLAAEMFGALIPAKFGNLRDRSRCIFEPVLCQPDPRIDYIIDRTYAERLLIQSLKPRPAQINAPGHGIDRPVKFRMEHHVTAQRRQLVMVRTAQ